MWLEPSTGSYQRAVPLRRARRRPIGGAPIACTRHVDPPFIRAGQPPRGPFAALGRFAARRRWPIVIAWAVVLLVALPFAPRAAGALRAGGFILDDLESARAKASLEDELGAPPSAVVVVFHSDRSPPGRRRSRPRPRTPIADVAGAPYVVRVVPAHARDAPGLGRPPHRLRRRPPRPPPDDSPDAAAGILARLPPSRRDRRRAGRRPGVLRRCPDGLGIGPAPERADLAAAGRARAADRLRVGGRGGAAARGRRRGRGRRAGGDLRGRVDRRR